MVERIPTFGLGRLPRITFGAGVFGRVPQIVATHGSRALLVLLASLLALLLIAKFATLTFIASFAL